MSAVRMDFLRNGYGVKRFDREIIKSMVDGGGELRWYVFVEIVDAR